MTKNKRGKSKHAETRHLVGIALLSAFGGAAVAGIALAIRSQVGAILGSVLMVIAVLGALYAVMWVGGAAMFLFFDQLSKGPGKAVNWYWRLVWLLTLISVPLSSYLLEFDRDQWIWGTGSTVLGLIILLIVLDGRPRKQA